MKAPKRKSPNKTIERPKNRICPSSSCKSWLNISRHLRGAMRGRSPSKINTSEMATMIEDQKLTYFFTAGAAWLPEELPLMVLKKSELLGSKTMTSLFLAKLAL